MIVSKFCIVFTLLLTNVCCIWRKFKKGSSKTEAIRNIFSVYGSEALLGLSDNGLVSFDQGIPEFSKIPVDLED